MSVLWLVRHAMPAHGPDVPADQWQLSRQGHQAAHTLRRVLPAAALLVSSAEPKARQTLEPAGQVHADARFNEVTRDEPYGGDFRAGRLAYVNGADHPGWETRAAVVARFDAAVTGWRSRASGRPLVIASHGMAITLWLTATIPLDDPAGFWTYLEFPDVLTVDLDTRPVERVQRR